ncbi:MAG: hypothetical protein ACYC6Y_19795, partial [Thermoguttaceae bacterium]
QLTNDDWQRLINWVDANGVYYDRYETNWPDRRIFDDESTDKLYGILSRRCDSCHVGGYMGGLTWWLSINWHDVTSSRALAAPLARSAGGWGRCDGTVFATTNDPDYQALLGVLTEIRSRLTARPREDLLSIDETAAGYQVVHLPPPPSKAPGRFSPALASLAGLIGIVPFVLHRSRRGRQQRTR